MKKKQKKIYLQRKKRRFSKIVGTIQKPRLNVFRSHHHIYAQLIDDQLGHTLAFSSTLDKKVKEKLVKTATCDASFEVGKDLGEKASLKNIQSVIFDRGTRPYHGRIEAIANGARTSGLKF
jgi:large subunit ribosomal protein L18